MCKAYAYSRISKDLLEQSGLSQEAQAKMCREYYERVLAPKGVEWGQLLFEAESAFRLPLRGRRMGALLMALLKYGDHLIIPKIDRAFRRVMDFVLTFDELEKRGIILHICDLNIDMSNIMGRAMAHCFCIMAAVFGELESKAVSDRVKAAHAVNRSRGRHLAGHVPLGYRIGDARKLIKDAEEWAVMEEIERRKSNFESSTIIARDLNSRHIKHYTRRPKGKLEPTIWSAIDVDNSLKWWKLRRRDRPDPPAQP